MKPENGNPSSRASPYRPSASWAIDSEAMRARGIIVLVKSNQLVKNIVKKNISQLKQDFNFAAKNPALFATSGL